MSSSAPPEGPEQDHLTSQFIEATGASSAEARTLLTSHSWDLTAAVSEYWMSQDEQQNDPTADAGDMYGVDSDLDDEPHTTGGGRTLGGEGTTSKRVAGSAAAGAARPQKKFATLGDLSAGDSHGHSHGDDSSDDEKQDFFAGGEKSGLAVQNPDDIKKKIIEKAKKAQPRAKEEKPARSHFTGAARTLGGDDEESKIIEDPNANAPKPRETVTRILHFWKDGFSIDDGPLYRSDDPANRPILEAIRQGRAPLSIMNVQVGQEVDVNLQPHDSEYVAPKKKYVPFSGSGQRLGSPAPALATKAPAASAPSETASTPAQPTIDESQPIITIQVRLVDGSRLTARFNASHTIGDVYNHVAAQPASQGRNWVLMTTFPSKELTDKAAALGDLSEFKRGGVIVQKSA